MKKGFCLMLAGALVLSALSGCGGQDASSVPDTENKDGKIVIRMMYFSNMPEFEALVESTCDDIDLQIEQNATATLNSESERRLRNHHGSDLIMTTLPTGVVKDYVYDLSAESFVLNYSGTMTKALLIDGHTMYIPLPGQYFGYILNKTLVEELGFEMPSSNQDMLDIMAAAQREKLGTGVNNDCFGFYMIGDSNFASYLIGSEIPDFLSTAEGIKWTNDFENGTGRFAGTWESCLDFLRACVENGYMDSGKMLSSSNVTLSNTNAIDVESRMLEGTLLITNSNIKLYQTLVSKSDKYEYEMIPFLSSQGNPPWLGSICNEYLAVNSDLAEEGNEKKLDVALRILRLLSTKEGQTAWMNDTDATFSYLKSFDIKTTDFPEGIRSAVEGGYVYTSSLPDNILQYLGCQMAGVLQGKSEMTDALALVDDYVRNGSASVDYDQSVAGRVAENLIYENYNTRFEETAIGNLVTDAIREYAGTDIALANGGGIRSSLYKGDVMGSDLSAVCPYSNLIIVVEMDGATLKEALLNGISQTNRGDEIPGGRFLQVSGIRYSYRPPEEPDGAGELVSATLADGSEIREDASYRVAIPDYMAGAVSYADGNGDGYVMLNVYDDTVPKGVELLEETNATYTDALKSYFANHIDEDITAKLEGRITIVTGE